MKGRLEHDLKNEKMSEQLAKEMPKEVQEWYYNLAVSMEPRSCYAYLSYMKTFLRFLGDPQTTKEITDIDVQRFMKSIETKTVNGELVSTSFSYRQVVYSALNKFFEYSVKKKWREDNPMQLIRRARQKDNVKRIYLTEDDLQKILTIANEEKESDRQKIARLRNIAILRVFMATGIRETALCEINTEDINFDNSTLTVVDKGNKTHIHMLGSKTMIAIKNWLDVRDNFLKGKSTNALFLSVNGRRIVARNVEDIVNEYTEAALGKRLSPHKLRAAYGTILYDKTKDIRLVQDRMGHSSVTTTQLYVVQDNSAAEKAAKLMDF